MAMLGTESLRCAVRRTTGLEWAMDAMEEQARAEGPQACCEAHDRLGVGNGRYGGAGMR